MLSLNHADKTPTLLSLKLCERPVRGRVDQIPATPNSAGINDKSANMQTYTTGSRSGMQGNARLQDE